MNFNMNLKYILIGLLGMNGAAVMPQAIQQEVVEPTENALIIPMNSQNVTTLLIHRIPLVLMRREELWERVII